MGSEPYSLLVGVGRLYIADANTAKPALDAAPGVAWRELGETDDGVKISKTQSIEAFSSDQRTGKVKATRTEEGITIEANLQESTLENLADVVGGTVTDVPAASGTIGKRSMGMHSGATVAEYAFLFRGDSPYGDYPAQYWVPRGYMDDDTEIEYKKGDKTLIPVKFEALEDLNAANESERFGIWEAQDAAALP
jgi:hypothetical protein